MSFDQAPAVVESAPVPRWTSGVRTPPVLQVQQELIRARGRDARIVHVFLTEEALGERCVLPAWTAQDVDFPVMGIARNAQGAWLVQKSQEEKVSRWLDQMALTIADCGKGAVLPPITTTEVDDGDENIGKVGVAMHLLSSQIHGGVLLGAADLGTGIRLPDGQLWSPDGKLFYAKLGDELHFWNARKTHDGSQIAQHVVFSNADAEQVQASDGHFRVLLRVPKVASVRKESRVRSVQKRAAAETLEVVPADTGVPSLQKIATPCWDAAGEQRPDCVDIGDGDAEFAIERLIGKTDAAMQPLVARRVADGYWLLDMDVSRLENYLQSEWDADATPVGALRAAASFGHWGFEEKARSAAASARDAVSSESDDVLLLGLTARDAANSRAAMVGLAIEMTLMLEARQAVTGAAVARRIQLFERMSAILQRLPVDVSAPLFRSLGEAAREVAGSPNMNAQAREKLVAAADRYELAAVLKQALSGDTPERD